MQNNRQIQNTANKIADRYIDAGTEKDFSELSADDLAIIDKRHPYAEQYGNRDELVSLVSGIVKEICESW